MIEYVDVIACAAVVEFAGAGAGLGDYGMRIFDGCANFVLACADTTSKLIDVVDPVIG